MRHAEWSEFDLDAAEWHIPREKMKMRTKHIVPLSKQAINTLKELQPITGDSKLNDDAVVGGLSRKINDKRA